MTYSLADKSCCKPLPPTKVLQQVELSVNIGIILLMHQAMLSTRPWGATSAVNRFQSTASLLPRLKVLWLASKCIPFQRSGALGSQELFALQWVGIADTLKSRFFWQGAGPPSCCAFSHGAHHSVWLRRQKGIWLWCSAKWASPWDDQTAI